MVVDELRPGLYRWTARHPAWVADADAESPGDWPAEVGEDHGPPLIWEPGS
jgi:hypothetical protein